MFDVAKVGIISDTAKRFAENLHYFPSIFPFWPISSRSRCTPIRSNRQQPQHSQAGYHTGGDTLHHQDTIRQQPQHSQTLANIQEVTRCMIIRTLSGWHTPAWHYQAAASTLPSFAPFVNALHLQPQHLTRCTPHQDQDTKGGQHSPASHYSHTKIVVVRIDHFAC